jgi:hypothetical protein
MIKRDEKDSINLHLGFREIIRGWDVFRVDLSFFEESFQACWKIEIIDTISTDLTMYDEPDNVLQRGHVSKP